MHANVFHVTITTGAAASTGASSVEADDQPGARFLSWHYIRAGSAPFATTAVLTITARNTGQVIALATLTATTGIHRAPRQPLYTPADLIIAAATTAGNHEYIFVGNQAIDLAIATAGVAKNDYITIITG